MKLKSIFTLFLFSILFSSCLGGIKKLQEEAGDKFGDQHFKTAISLIELHKIRTGAYPATLNSLKYLGDWDPIILGSVSYLKLDTGYQLDLVDNGLSGKAKDLKYPKDFWNGLGLKKSNVKD